jgi:hypothetical protein
VLVRQKEEEFIFTIYKAITNAGLTLKKAFEVENISKIDV